MKTFTTTLLIGMLKALMTTLLISVLAAGFLASFASAKTALNKTYKPGAATRYTQDGDFGTVIGPKVKRVLRQSTTSRHTPVSRHKRNTINPQPEPPGRR
jgi:hypothetical protein